jgi:hypothetical protein
MYERILVAIDATPAEENQSALARTEQIGRLTGATVYVLHFARCRRRMAWRRRTAKLCSGWSTDWPQQASTRMAKY